jgi:hypothetical protein
MRNKTQIAKFIEQRAVPLSGTITFPCWLQTASRWWIALRAVSSIQVREFAFPHYLRFLFAHPVSIGGNMLEQFAGIKRGFFRLAFSRYGRS